MSTENLWKQLSDAGFTVGNFETTTHVTPWYLRVLVGFSGWLASFFLFGFIALLFPGILFDSNTGYLSVIGLVFCFASYCLYRFIDQNDFTSQLALCFSLCGQLVLAIAWVIKSHESFFVFFVLAGYQALLAYLFPNFLHRVLCTWFASISLYWGFSTLNLSILANALIISTTVALWTQEHNWGKNRKQNEAFGFGLAIALLHLAGQFLFVGDIAREVRNLDYTAYQQELTFVLLLVVFSLLVRHIFRVANIEHNPIKTIRLILISAIYAALAWFVPSAASALLLVTLGFYTQRKSLMALGTLALVTFVSWYYYFLDQSLLYKSIILMGLGLVALGTTVTFHLEKKYRDIFSESRNNIFQKQKIYILLVSLVILSVVNFGIYQKEQHLKEGRTVYLKLAPVDPRSLMQGDYMRLRFELENSLRSNIDLDEPQNGLVIVNIDAKNIGHFEQIKNGGELNENQVALQYRVRNSRIKFATNAFFFQEGKADHFSKAEFGEFKVAENGALLLVAMRDKDLNRL